MLESLTGVRAQGVSQRISAGATNEAISRQGKRVARLFSHFAVLAARSNAAEHARAAAAAQAESTSDGAADEVDAMSAVHEGDMEVWRSQLTKCPCLMAHDAPLILQVARALSDNVLDIMVHPDVARPGFC